MEVLVIVHAYVPKVRGGAEIMMHEMVNALKARGHRVTVCVPEDGKKEMKRARPDVVISHLLHTEMAYSFAKDRGAKFVQVYHNDNRHSRVLSILPADLKVTNTKWLRDALHLSDALVVHPPVWPKKHKTKPGDKITLVNLIPEKGSELFYMLARMNPGLRFLGVKGGYGDQVVKPSPNIEIIDTTDNMRRDVWAKTGILLMPSAYESYGMAAVEATCSGIPVIAHPTKGLRESMGDAAVFVDRRDTVGWVRAIKDIRANVDRYRDAALRLSDQINTQAELTAFCEAVEAL